MTLENLHFYGYLAKQEPFVKSHEGRLEFYITYIHSEKIWLHWTFYAQPTSFQHRDRRINHGLSELGQQEGEKQPIFRQVTRLKGNVEIADKRGLGVEP